jgi:hypothetical protein
MSTNTLGLFASKQQVATLCVNGDMDTLKQLDFSHFTEGDFEFVFQKLMKRMENPNPDDDGFVDSIPYKLAYTACNWLMKKKDSIDEWATNDLIVDPIVCKLSDPCVHRVKSKTQTDAQWCYMNGKELCDIFCKEGRRNSHFEQYSINLFKG